MSDDLMKRLQSLHKQATVERSHFYVGSCAEDAMHRIEELEAESKTLRSMVADVIADTGDDPEIMAASRAEWAARASTAEAKVRELEEEVERGFWAGRSCGGSKAEIDAALAALLKR